MYAYKVREPFHAPWLAQTFLRGDVIRGDDARKLEDADDEEMREMLRRCTRVHDSAFAHHDVPAAEPEAPKPEPAAAAALSSPAVAPAAPAGGNA